MYYIYPYTSNEIYHHGIKGQRWGIRRYQNEDGTLTPEGRKKYLGKQADRINLMYDREKRWTDRKIGILDAKGKKAKADVWRYANEKNEAARKEKLDALNKMTTKAELNASKRHDHWLYIGNGQDFLASNKANMTSFLTRLNEYSLERGARWMSNFTFNETLASITPQEGYEYLRAKAVASKHRSRGYNNSTSFYR